MVIQQEKFIQNPQAYLSYSKIEPVYIISGKEVVSVLCAPEQQTEPKHERLMPLEN